mgnify:CR=1 FL=1|jgi:hypothetical protein
MTFEQFTEIYSHMIELYKQDSELTNIELNFHIQPVQSERKTAIINIKTFDDGNRL